MKSGLVGRNNMLVAGLPRMFSMRLNEVRPSRPEQCLPLCEENLASDSLNEVRPSRPEQSGNVTSTPDGWSRSQ